MPARFASMKFIAFAFAIIISLLFSQGLHAQSFESRAPYAVIIEGESGIVLYEKNAREPIGPSSMTKIMTAEIVFSRLKDGSLTLDTTMPVSEKAWRKGGSKMWVDVNSSVRVEDLLRGVIVQSGNDACIVLAEGISGSEDMFAQLMTTRANDLGLSTANFKNASGWPADGHVISVMDLALLARHVILTYPEYYTYYAETEFTWNDITQPNRNPLLGRVSGADGMKTGHTEDNGYGLVGTVERDGRRIIFVINGLDSVKARTEESVRIANSAFASYDVKTAYAAGETVTQADMWIGEQEQVDLVVTDDITLGFHKSDADEIKMRAEFDNPVLAPVTAGDVLGKLIVSMPGRSDMEYDLVAKDSVAKKGLIGRILAGLGPLKSGKNKEAKAEE